MATAKKKSRKGSEDPARVPHDDSERSMGSTIFEWVRSIAIAVLLALIIRWPLIEPFKIPSGSMEPTFVNGDRIFVNKFRYGVRYPFNGFRIPYTRTTIWYSEGRIFQGTPPQRWDIVVFKSVESKVEHDVLVKRIVGMPGERIHIKGGKVYADGEPLELPPSVPDVFYTAPQSGYSGMRYGVRTEDAYALVPAKHYLVLGDNSDHSRDGRYFGWLPEHHILGRVSSIWWPLGRWRDLTGYTRTWWWRSLIAVFGSWVFVRMFLGRSWRIYFSLSSPSFTCGEHVYVNRIALGIPIPFTRKRLVRFGGLTRGEVVLYEPLEKNPTGLPYLIGWVGALPGDQIGFDEGKLRIGKEAPHALADLHFSHEDVEGRYGRSKGKEYSLVPDRHYFLLAENDAGAPDSRTLGWIPHERIVGKVSGVWWPPTRLRRVSGPAQTAPHSHDQAAGG